MTLNLMIICEDPISAIEAEEAGIDRIFFDLEYINKHERQRGLNTVISNNVVADLQPIRKVITNSTLLVRTNPINAHIENEINEVIDKGADILMLPMAVDCRDVEAFVKYVNGRTKIIIMIETTQALSRIDNILKVQGIDEIFIGLNDLHLGLGLNFMFEVLSGGLVEYAAYKCKRNSIPFGFGGIARIGDGILPADRILGEHFRLGSSSVILSRTFKGQINNEGLEKINLVEEIDKVREKEREISKWTKSEFEQNKKCLIDIVNGIVSPH